MFYSQQSPPSDLVEELTAFNTPRDIPFPTVTTSRLSLIRPQPNYAEAYRELLNDPSFLAHFDSQNVEGVSKEPSISDVLKDLRYRDASFYRRHGIMWLLVSGPNLVGFIRIFAKSHWTLEFATLRQFRNQGYMSEVLPRCVLWAHSNGIDALVAYVNLANEPSIQLLNRMAKKQETLPVLQSTGALKLQHVFWL